MSLVSEFKEFAMKGNVVDMAVGVIIGGAFGKIVTSLVNDLIMPVLSTLSAGGGNLENYKLVLSAATDTTKEVAITYGNFLQTVIHFLIIAWSIFLVIKGMNRLIRRREKEAQASPAPAAPPADIQLLTEIRALLKK